MVPISANTSSGSGLDGDTKSTSPTEFYNSFPFAVGSGASATANPSGGINEGGDEMKSLLLYAGVGLIGLVVVLRLLDR